MWYLLPRHTFQNTTLFCCSLTRKISIFNFSYALCIIFVGALRDLYYHERGLWDGKGWETRSRWTQLRYHTLFTTMFTLKHSMFSLFHAVDSNLKSALFLPLIKYECYLTPILWLLVKHNTSSLAGQISCKAHHFMVHIPGLGDVYS
jgi:hypothetical protein